MPLIEIPSALRARAAGKAKVKVAGATVGEALESLCRAHPELRPQLFAQGGQLKRSVGVFVEEPAPPRALDPARAERALEQLDPWGPGLSRPLGADELVVLIAAMAGG